MPGRLGTAQVDRPLDRLAGRMPVNVCRTKKLTNMRAAGRDDNVKLKPPRRMSLEECLESIEDDELLEITPKRLRLRKLHLSEVDCRRESKRAKAI